MRGVKDVDTLQRRIDDFVRDEPGLRVTLIGPDGTVLADTSRDALRLESHAHRPEIVEARDQRVGRSVRHSETTRQRPDLRRPAHREHGQRRRLHPGFPIAG